MLKVNKQKDRRMGYPIILLLRAAEFPVLPEYSDTVRVISRDKSFMCEGIAINPCIKR